MLMFFKKNAELSVYIHVYSFAANKASGSNSADSDFLQSYEKITNYAFLGKTW
jgi:hypothetical protein